jgi:hypothetical protein
VPGEAIPLFLQSLAATSDHPVLLGREHAWNAFVIYGVGLDYHLLYDSAARDALDPDINPTDIWDYVVLQDYSSQWREQPDAFFYGVSSWDARIKMWGAQRNPNVATVLWENWTWLDRPDDIANLVAAYATIAGPPPQGVNAILVPNGQAWSRYRSETGSTSLWVDYTHPTYEGQYLAACVFYATLFRETPCGLSPLKLAADRARLFQNIAHRTALPSAELPPSCQP